MNILIEPLDPDSVPAAALIAKLDAYLLDLEDIARLAGYNTLRLETGIYQPEALRMFENNGYARTGPTAQSFSLMRRDN